MGIRVSDSRENKGKAGEGTRSEEDGRNQQKESQQRLLDRLANLTVADNRQSKPNTSNNKALTQVQTNKKDNGKENEKKGKGMEEDKETQTSQSPRQQNKEETKEGEKPKEEARNEEISIEEENTTEERLDRATANISWKEAFPRAVVQHLQRYRSDHSPILIDMVGDSTFKKKRVKKFRFEEVWLEKEECEEIVKRSWIPGRSGVKRKLEICSKSLEEWGKNQFGQILKAQHDNYCWKFNKRGEYEVKGAYHMIRSHNKGPESNSAPIQTEQQFWKKLWKMKIPLRTQNFIWRLMNKSLPTCNNLQRRGIRCSEICPRCWKKEESDTHLFRDCEWVQRLWFISPLTLRTEAATEVLLQDWIRSMVVKIGEEMSDFFVCVLHSIWQERNKLVFEHIQTAPKDLLQKAQKALIDAIYPVHSSTAMQKTPPGSLSPRTWIAPPLDSTR
ncbi:hypothetical protein Ahy_A02g009608 [Arachis hypogaea]|uniref:Reverse transcriptase zinc-binding domain-containing protein n=1 Tax=Arachis hypogaea TaxID=3818 RepID=A0A445EHH5_ARAHY|nr:hypothetical protein Ahy_A02g009608 [Arachis hypogaea]